MNLERGLVSLVSTTKELLERKSRVSGLEIGEYGRRGSFTLTAWHPLSAKFVTNFTDKRQLLGQYSSLADSGHEVCLFFVLFDTGRQRLLASYYLVVRFITFPIVYIQLFLTSMGQLFGCFLSQRDFNVVGV
jgi:hypothetical protein